MMSHCNSPLLGRSSPFRCSSVDRGDEYQMEKDLVIGELTSRMRSHVKKTKDQGRHGFDKGRRDDFEDDHFIRPPSPKESNFAFEFNKAREEQEEPKTPNPVYLDPSEFSYKSPPQPVDPRPYSTSTSTSTSTLNPQRTATASIKLAPSPKVTRRNRSPSPKQNTSTARMSRASNGSLCSTASSSSTSTSTSRPRATPNYMRSTSASANGRPAVNRSISVQSTANRNRVNAAANGAMPRKPLAATINSKGLRPLAQTGLNRSISADPNMNDPEIMAKIGNRATKVVQKSIGKCGSCNKAINEDGCTAFGKVYHKACFKCTVCKQTLSGKFFEKDGKPYCAKDFQKSQESCAVCNMPIKGDSVVSNSKVFHPECMKCYICGDSLKGTYFTFQDKPICERDYKQKADKCSQCGESPPGTYYAVNDQIFCEMCHQDAMDKCPRCHTGVSGCGVRVSGSSFHKECFTCVVCNKNMATLPFIADDKLDIYCSEDYNRKRAPKCSFCKKPIVPKEGQKSAPRLRALDRDFHPQCFQCEDCGLVLDSRVKGRECYPFKNHILCVKCNRKKLSSSEESEDDSEYTEE